MTRPRDGRRGPTDPAEQNAQSPLWPDERMLNEPQRPV
jgi:hypothetical protein